MKNTWKSIGAIILGLIIIFILSSVTDFILEKAGVLPMGNLYVSAGLIFGVICYRIVYSVLGCYSTARLAPQNPMKHAIILGVIGVILSLVGVVVNYKMNLGPAWYPWSLVVLALPAAWLGGKLATKNNN